MLSKENWDETKRKWDAYWRRENAGAPLMHIIARRPGAGDREREDALKSRDMSDKYMDAARIDARVRYFAETHEYLAESFPNASLDFGPGSMAAYLGSDITFAPDTVWFSECVPEWENWPDLRFDPENDWFCRHVELFNRMKALSKGDYYLAIPDIMENLDVIASLRGAQNTAYDLIDEPDEVLKRVRQVQDVYWRYYDSFYEIASVEEDGVPSSAYTCFQIWGRGKTLKLQCDYSAMMSPKQFDRFVAPALERQSSEADHTLYHLDGPDAIRHLPTLMAVKGIDALQWTSGSYNPDGTFDVWYPIYDQVKRARKGLWVQVYNGEPRDWVDRIDKLVRRYGSNALFLCFPEMDMADAEMIIDHARKNWSDVEGDLR